uniref:Nuclease n=1 Tax=Aeromonas hydrophila TaxID=644 RepID=Q44070_AERHY|nr:nuclease [Aeromonas hydrophila]
MSGRHSLLALSVALALSGQAQAQLLITEYLEGSGNNKALELSNLDNSALDLTPYRLALYANDRTLAAGPTNNLALQGTLAPGASLVLGAPLGTARNPGQGQPDQRQPGVQRRRWVSALSGDEIVDSVGQIGVDPGTAWVSGAVSTLDMTLRRKASVNTGRVDATAAFDPAAEYLGFARDEAAGLVCSGEDNCDGNQPPAFACPVDSLIPVPAIQGSGERTPLVPPDKFESETSYPTRGVLTQVVSALYKGFFIQDLQGDGDPASSDALFVQSNQTNPALVPGAEVCVSGKVKEYYNQTQLSADEMTVTQPMVGLVPAVDLVPVAGESLTTLLERHEGMRVRLVPASSLVVTRNFSFDYERQAQQPGAGLRGAPHQVDPEVPGHERAGEPVERAQPGEPAGGGDGCQGAGRRAALVSRLRCRAGVSAHRRSLEQSGGGIGYSYDFYRLVADNKISPVDVDHSGWDRVETPELAAAGDLRVASFNVLNFFTTVVGGDANPTNSNRGALTVGEFELQRTKIVSAITRLNADVVGLMEIEDNGYGNNSAIANLVGALNAALPDEQDHYAFVHSPDDQPMGTDAITVGLIYRPAKVSLEGAAQLIPLPLQVAEAVDGADKPVSIRQGMRDSLLQRFTSPKGDVPLTLVVNHLKSKGSACYEDYPDYVTADPLDGQGHCNALRVSAAKVLGERLKQEPGDLLVIGDLNAYGLEDPVRVLTDYDPAAQSRQIMSAAFTQLAGQPYEEQATAMGKGAGLINLNTQFHGTDTYSYSYEGELGNLDHALANPSLAKKVVGIEDWHINSAESNFFEYGKKYSGQLGKSEGPFSASDHDPVLVAIQYPLPPTGELSLTTSAANVEEGSTLTLAVQRKGGSRGAASVSWSVQYGSADRQDLAPLSGVLNWSDGDEQDKTLQIPTLSDTKNEGDETFTLLLQDASGATLGAQSQTLVTIKDKIAPSTIAMQSAVIRVNEGQWLVEVPLVRSGDLSKPARAQLPLDGMTPRWGLDFLPWLGQSVSWPAGEGGVKSIKVLFIDDWFVEPTEQFRVSLSRLQGAEGGESQTRVEIQDNDKPWCPFAR